MNTKIVEMGLAIDRLVAENPLVVSDIWFPILFGGDRFSCCDEAAVVEVDGKIVALATIAPRGEMDSGDPTIVGLYTIRTFRRNGYGKSVLAAAVSRCLERGFARIRVDVFSPNAKRTVESLPSEFRAVLEVNEQSMFGGLLQ